MTRKGLILLGIWFFAAQASAGEHPALKTQKEKVSYAAGVDMARSLQRQGSRSTGIYFKGVKDGLSGGTLLLSDDDINKMLKAFKTEQKMKLAERKYQQSEQLRKQREASGWSGREPESGRGLPGGE